MSKPSTILVADVRAARGLIAKAISTMLTEGHDVPPSLMTALTDLAKIVEEYYA